MGSEDRGCCDKCAKTFIMAVNILIILIGGAILAAGVYWQLSDTGFYKEIFNHDIFNIPIISIVIGSLLLLVGVCGFIGACCEVLFLLKMYMGFLIIIMLVQIVLAVGCVAMKTTVEEYAANRTLELIGYYGTSADEEGIIELTIDAIQEDFDCCGVYGPSDWADENSNYSNKSVPNSCCMTAYRSNSTCGNEPYTSNKEINTSGCKTSLTNWVSENLLYVGIVAAVVVVLQIMILIMVSKFRTTLEDEDYLNF